MESFIFGIKVALLGMGIVFVTLVFLIYIIKFMTKVINVSETKKKNIPEPVASKNEMISQEQQMNVADDAEIVAVIAAAVACLTQGKMKIKTIKRVKEEKFSAWSIAGRQETMYLRQSL
ncbi:MAG: OadG family protein [Clostridia bacterium]|nr:OadG family protein [Clostridia bacterium]